MGSSNSPARGLRPGREVVADLAEQRVTLGRVHDQHREWVPSVASSESAVRGCAFGNSARSAGMNRSAPNWSGRSRPPPRAATTAPATPPPWPRPAAPRPTRPGRRRCSTARRARRPGGAPGRSPAPRATCRTSASTARTAPRPPTRRPAGSPPPGRAAPAPTGTCRRSSASIASSGSTAVTSAPSAGQHRRQLPGARAEVKHPQPGHAAPGRRHAPAHRVRRIVRPMLGIRRRDRSKRRPPPGPFIGIHNVHLTTPVPAVDR